MKGAYLSLASLAPLLHRPCLDLRLYVLLVQLAASTGRVGTPTDPISARRLARLLAVPGGNGQAPEEITHRGIARALVRLEGNPDRPAAFPRYLSLVRAVGRRGAIYQLEQGRGEVCLIAPAAHPAAHARTLETAVNGRSRGLSTGQPPTQPPTSNNTLFLSENVREAPVDKATGRAKLEAMRAEFSRGSLK